MPPSRCDALLVPLPLNVGILQTSYSSTQPAFAQWFLGQPCVPLVSPLSCPSATFPLAPAHLLQEEEALLSEMDVTGQAFEDMQEQNGRLLQQLREKDDANFKLMSERIKANQIHKLLREEKDELGEQVLGLKSQVSLPWAGRVELERQGCPSTESPPLPSGGCPAADRAEAGGERAGLAGQPWGCREGADAAQPGPGAQQEEGEAVREGTATWDAGSHSHFVILSRELQADHLG